MYFASEISWFCLIPRKIPCGLVGIFFILDRRSKESEVTSFGRDVTCVNFESFG